MNDMTVVSLISMLGFLVLAGAALASFRLNWSKTVQLALTWLAIFVGLFVLARLAGLQL